MANKLHKSAYKYLEKVESNLGELSPVVKNFVLDAFKEGYRQGMPHNQGTKEKVFNKPTKKLVDDMKCLYGIPPHDNGGNIVMGDDYFSADLKRRIDKEGCSWGEVLEIAKAEGRTVKPSWDR